MFVIHTEILFQAHTTWKSFENKTKYLHKWGQKCVFLFLTVSQIERNKEQKSIISENTEFTVLSIENAGDKLHNLDKQWMMHMIDKNNNQPNWTTTKNNSRSSTTIEVSFIFESKTDFPSPLLYC